MDFLDAIMKIRAFLEERMDPEYGLLDKIHEENLVDWREKDDINSKGSSCEKNSLLLSRVLLRNDKYGFIRALQQAAQTHIANYIRAYGEYSVYYGNDWPLTEREISILDANHGSFADLLDLTDLLGRLYSSKVINKRQMDSISSKPTSHEKNEKLLNILRRRSLRDYQQTVFCLHESQQSHIAKVLTDGGVVVRVHGDLSEDVENVTGIEKEIATKIEGLFIGTTPGAQIRILEFLHHRVIAAKPDRSIVLYIYCKTIDELQQLQESLTSGKLKDSVELWFNSLLNRSQRISVKTLTVSAEEFKQIRTHHFKEKFILRAIHDFEPEQMNGREQRELAFVSGTRSDSKQMTHKTVLPLKAGNKMKTIRPENIGDTDGWWQVKHLDNGDIGYIPRNCVVIVIERDHKSSETTLNSLLLELLDAILEKSYLYWKLNSSSHQTHGYVIRALSSVDFCWFQRITKRRFKSRIWNRMKVFCDRNKRITTIIRSNRNYFLQNIHLNEKMMLSLNCVTEEQSRLIQQPRPKRDKNDKLMDVMNDKLLSLMKSLDETKISNFVQRLRQTNQKMVARIFENGGGVIKVQVQSRVAKCMDMHKLHQNIEDYRNRAAPWSYQADKHISQLMDEDIEILNSQIDRRTVVVWMWCRSQEAVVNLRRLYHSNKLREILFGFANIRQSAQENIQQIVINIDNNQFKKTVVVHSISINVIKRIRDESVSGITKLRNDIYVACHSEDDDYHVGLIHVFEDRNPFRRKKEIEMEEIGITFDIGSSEKDNCLYVSDNKEKCIWKMTEEIDVEYKIIKWLTTNHESYTLSVSRNGHLLLNNGFSLMIYGSDAKLIRSIQLPSDIGYIHHAVETSIGNIIILHNIHVEIEKISWPLRRPMGKLETGKIVSELKSDGQMVVRRFIPSDEEQILGGCVAYLALDSDDKVFLADDWSCRVILLDSHLKWNQYICATEAESRTERKQKLCYDEKNEQLIVGSTFGGINVYSVSRK